MNNAIYLKTLLLLALVFLVINVKRSSCVEYFDVIEDSNFKPCVFDQNSLVCNAKNMDNVYENKHVRFPKPNRLKITKIELLNFAWDELPANEFQTVAPGLLSIRILSKSKIKSIDSQTFVGCNDVTFLEIVDASNDDTFLLNFDNVFTPLQSLEELKLTNLNARNLKESFFSSLSNLKSFTIECSLFNSLSPETFRSNKQLISLSFIGMKNATDLIQTIENWPLTSKLMIKSLQISRCDLKKFPKFSVNLVGNLSQLSLAKNPIVQIGLDDIGVLTKLETLSLASTNLDRGSVPGLKLLTNLKDLKINDINTLSDLPVEIESMESLELISIDMSKFQTISIALPASIRKISASNLQKPVQITSNFLSRSSKLNILYLIALPMDNIQFLLDNSKVISYSLNVLSLDDTSLIKNRLLEFLSSLRNLEVLYLNRANIDFITDNALFNLRSLKKLMLSGNYLRYESINTAGFQDIVTHLTDLDLSKNHLTSVPPCMFYNFPNFVGLHLHDNSIICDCHVLWLRETLTRINVTNSHLNFTCSSGTNDAKSFYQLSAEDLKNCSTKDIDNCIPIRNGSYKVGFSGAFTRDGSVLSIDRINGTGLKFLFDYLTVNVRQLNNSYHSDLDKYDLTRRSIEVTPRVQSADIEVCLVLNRNKVEYMYNYNCQTVQWPTVVSESRLSVIAGVLAGVGTLVLILVIVAVICYQRKRRKKENQHEYYEASSTAYSEPDDTYKTPDQYTYVSNEHYSIEPDESFEHRSLSPNGTIPISNQLSKLNPNHSKSMDNDMNISKTSSNQPKSRFRKRPHIADLISKARSSSNLLDRPRSSLPNTHESISMRDIGYNGSATMPRQYLARALPQTPSTANIDDLSRDNAPPKPRLSNANIQHLLNNADQHLKYFSQYISNNSLCTDESANHPHSGDSGLGVSKVSNNLNHSLYDGTSVII